MVYYCLAREELENRQDFRSSQNWIGGTRPGNTLCVPLPVEYLSQCLSDFEHFLYNDTLPVLIKAGLAHGQFESIHPFLDGNGRLGRLLITLLLYNNQIVDEPILYLSLYLKQNRTTYYNLLQEVRLHGTWETWLEFFLKGIYESAKQATQTAININALFHEDSIKINNLGRAKFSREQILEYLKKLPQVTVPLIADALKMTPPTVRSVLNHVVTLSILEEMKGKQPNKVYVYKKYLKILEEGTEPIIDFTL